jgi:folate-binding protein YgfZ
MPDLANPESYAAAHQKVAWRVLGTREQLLIRGPDAVSFVQGMVTNDVAALQLGQACPVCLLTAKGAMVGDGRVARLEHGLLLDTGPGRGEAVAAFLNKYLISEDAEVVANTDFAVVALVGPGAEAMPEAVAVLPSSLGNGVDVLVPRSKLPAIEARLVTLPHLDEVTAEVLRVEAGVPVFGVDMTETTIPLEANLEAALHYKKGCYIGQEVIARATYRGQMNKKLMGLLLGNQPVAPKTELRQAERKVGWVTSPIFSPARQQHVALGYVHRDFLGAGTRLHVATGGEAEVVSLPLT